MKFFPLTFIGFAILGLSTSRTCQQFTEDCQSGETLEKCDSLIIDCINDEVCRSQYSDSQTCVNANQAVCEEDVTNTFPDDKIEACLKEESDGIYLKAVKCIMNACQNTQNNSAEFLQKSSN
jgi:hypothetical protein